MKDMKQFKLWVPEDLKGRIAAAAKVNGWSANREAVDALRKLYPPEIMNGVYPTAMPLERADAMTFEDRLAVLKAGIRPGSIEMSWLLGGIQSP